MKIYLSLFKYFRNKSYKKLTFLTDLVFDNLYDSLNSFRNTLINFKTITYFNS